MKSKLTHLFLALIAMNVLSAQVIKVNPYLQNATPSSIYIMWETNLNNESIVEWGSTAALGNTTLGSAVTSNGTSQIHTVQINGLTRFSKYYYRVRTGNAVSDILSFKTPPFASDHESFRMVAMSDMQMGNDANKYNEVIHNGILNYMNQEVGGAIEDNLAMVLIPGDLVDDGENYLQWENDFFDPSTDLFGKVPVYPVLGNHDLNADYYFKYFNLPNNGSVGYLEHWWFMDYGNVRVIGLDSNDPYDNVAEQLTWLNQLLDNTCANTDIDFVFAQLHHPHKSEMWTPGESAFTGNIIDALEQFSTNCSKPSIHFFGHTHGYSRGSSKDHKHLWVNVASAGGALDYWGQFPNMDYDEFSVSRDEYGFVVLEVTDDNDPKIVLKRISRGDDNISLDNAEVDQITIRLNPSQVDTPTAVYPNGDTDLIAECVTLQASPFSSPNNNALHGQSQWQLALSSNGFATPILEYWKNYQNWYNDVDTQAGEDITNEKMVSLEPGVQYWWRVRYRDRELNWSSWSVPASFSTGSSSYSANLIDNPGSENQLNSWIITQGVVESVTDQECDGTTPHAGIRYFAVGGVCQNSVVGQCIQKIDVSEYANLIDQGGYVAYFGGYLSDYSGIDVPEMRIVFYDNLNNELGFSPTLLSTSSQWALYSNTTPIPVSTRRIQMELKGTRYGGDDNDSYFDDIFLKIGSANANCNVAPMTLNMKIFLQGSYTDSNQLMNDPLRVNNKIPLIEPHTSLGFTNVGSGGEQINNGVLAVSGNQAIVDWVWVELRDGTDPTSVVATLSALVQRDGDVVSMDGTSPLHVNLPPGVQSVYVVLRHRNHFSVGTANAFSVDATATIDFTNPTFEVFGEGSLENNNGNMVLIAGDANRDGHINVVDRNAYWRIQNAGVYDYYQSTADFNLDGVVNGVDRNDYWRVNNTKEEPLYEPGYAKVVSVTTTGSAGNYNFQVGLLSPDTGCDQYANWWEVLTEDGQLIYRRILGHSHVNEQPFIRSGGPVNIPDNQTVIIRAHMNTVGYGTQTFKGSVQTGFTTFQTINGFASNVENQSPQPTNCAF